MDDLNWDPDHKQTFMSNILMLFSGRLQQSKLVQTSAGEMLPIVLLSAIIMPFIKPWKKL